MTEQDTNHKGGRPKAVKGKARTKTISTRLTLAEWKTVMKRIADAGQEAVALPARTIASMAK